MSGFHLPVSKRVGGAVSAARNVKKTISASLDESLPVQDGVTVDNLDVAATANALDPFAEKYLDMVSLGFASTMDIQRSTGGFPLS